MLPLWKDADAGIRVVRLEEHEEIEALVNVFQDVVAEKGWQPEGALSLYRDWSFYFGLEVRGQFAGGLQLELPDATGSLSCQSIWPEVNIGPSHRCAHVTILALNRAFRGQGRLFWHVVVEMWRYCVGKGINRLFIEVSPRILPLYLRLGWPLQAQGEARLHWGAPTYLRTLGIPEVAEAILRRAEHSPYYQQIIAQAFRLNDVPEGIGTHQAVSRSEEEGSNILHA
jgi:hypothetical protein